jgi:hypothetical protein
MRIICMYDAQACLLPAATCLRADATDLIAVTAHNCKHTMANMDENNKTSSPSIPGIQSRRDSVLVGCFSKPYGICIRRTRSIYTVP